jgi:hypothetical protein
MVNNRGYILHKANHKKGKRHDYHIYRNNHSVTAPKVVSVLGLGNLGVKKDFSEQLLALPYKRNRNQDLSQGELENNKIHSKKRIVA